MSAAAKGFYFYFHEGKLSGLTLVAECLAQGLAQLRVPVYSNIASPLFTTRSVHQPGPEAYVFVLTDKTNTPEYLAQIVAYPAEKKLILSMGDDIQNHLTPPGIPALMTHENRLLTIDGDRRPWAFGISAQVAAMTANPPPFRERQAILLKNFRPSLHQSVRQCLDLALVPHLARHFAIDDRLSDEQQDMQRLDHISVRPDHSAHFADHFDKLKNYVGCLAYGGEFFSNLSRNGHFKNVKAFRHYHFQQDPVVLRWDSFRLWESWAAGCLTFHLDFDKYGFKLPVMPEAWQHYVPIDLADPAGTAEALMTRRNELADIAHAGMIWARLHYGPEGVARRLLAIVDGDGAAA